MSNYLIQLLKIIEAGEKKIDCQYINIFYFIYLNPLFFQKKKEKNEVETIDVFLLDDRIHIHCTRTQFQTEKLN